MQDSAFLKLLDYLGLSWSGYRKVRRGVKKRVARHMGQCGCRTLGRVALRHELARNWPLYAISGMALGFDTWAAETCVELGIPFVAALPCDGMDAVWPLPSQERFRGLLSKAQEIHVVSPVSVIDR